MEKQSPNINFDHWASTLSSLVTIAVLVSGVIVLSKILQYMVSQILSFF